jgi:topoisomerase-4 subunit A
LTIYAPPRSVRSGAGIVTRARDTLDPFAKSENSKVVYLEVSAKEKDLPKSVHMSLDGRPGARVREIDFDLISVPVSTRTAKGLTITKWSIKEVKVNDLALK